MLVVHSFKDSLGLACKVAEMDAGWLFEQFDGLEQQLNLFAQGLVLFLIHLLFVDHVDDDHLPSGHSSFQFLLGLQLLQLHLFQVIMRLFLWHLIDNLPNSGPLDSLPFLPILLFYHRIVQPPLQFLYPLLILLPTTLIVLPDILFIFDEGFRGN